MRNIIFILIIIPLFTLSVSSQITMEGVTLPGHLNAGNDDLVLNGAGVREKLWWDLYVGGLYLLKKSRDDAAITNADEPMAVKMHIISSMITSERMQDAVREGFDKSTDGNIASIKTRIDKLINTFSDEIKIGDIFDLVYVPATGVEVYKNGKLSATIKGLDFKKALFGIWLSDDPVDKGLKKGMLGLE